MLPRNLSHCRNTLDGRRDTNLRRHYKNAFDERSATDSIFTAFDEEHMNMATYVFYIALLRIQ